jgi:glutaredoxin
MWRLTIYSKRECCLCDDAKRAISEFSKECELALEDIDITTDKALWEKYCYDIPVLLLDGEEIARHHIGLKKLRVIRQRREAAGK